MAGSHRLLTSLAPLLFGLGALSLATGCEATVETEPVYVARQPVIVEEPGPVVWVEGPPVVDIDVYPVYVYGGTNVYFVNDRWYYCDGGRWAYYREEPRELVEYRTRANVVASVSDGGPAPRSGAAPQQVGASPVVRPTGPVPAHAQVVGESAPAREIQQRPAAAQQVVAEREVHQAPAAQSQPVSAPAPAPARRVSRPATTVRRSKR